MSKGKRTAGVGKRPVAIDYEVRRVKPGQMSWTCRLNGLRFRTTEEIRVGDGIIGQRRAVDALLLGMEIESAGYNIFVTGPVGTGRTTTVRELLQKHRHGRGRSDDKCYVNNFKDPDQPRLVRLPSGHGQRLRKAMDEFIAFLVKNVPLLFESEGYQRSRQAIVDGFKERGTRLVHEFEKKVASEGFALVQTAPFMRPELAPIVDKQPVKIEALPAQVEEGKITAEQAAALRKRYEELTEELNQIFKEMREFERSARQLLAELDSNVVKPLLEDRMAEVRERIGVPVANNPKLAEYLEEVKEAVLERLDLFRQQPEPEKDKTSHSIEADPYIEFRVNVLVDNGDSKGVPVVEETNPSYKNLFGAIERVWDRSGQWRTDFTRIKAGSIVKADGGFLVVHALDVLLEPGVWPALKRTLRNRRLEISTYDPLSYMFGASAMKPEPIDLELKVIMIGDPYLYSLLAVYDEDFRKVFKVRADFDWVMPLDDRAVRDYVRVIKSLCEKERLRPFDRSGVARVVEYGVRMAGRRNKLSTRFNIITDLLKEASYWAGKNGAGVVTGEHVRQAIEKRRDRVRLYEEKLQELITQGTIFIDVKGRAVGQVNGLAVYDTGEYAFGKPVRITAKTAVGSAGIINIEREAQLSGPTHDKGVYILAGYLRHKYAQDQPLVLSASICFEQSYGGVDGDSASSTEVYALLSDLSGLPVRQDLAVTGSVNQQGQIQPIGGVNWKIEGFFDVCKARGLTGTQGVIIPKANEPELLLREDVVEAVRQRRFHVYSISTIDEGVELLTGVPAGKPDRNGQYPEGTVNYLVKKRLAELADLYRRHQEEKQQASVKPKTAQPPEKKVWRRCPGDRN
ncbi:MAG: AAA family ATPase [candidate division WOR-3 bacterium]